MNKMLFSSSKGDATSTLEWKSVLSRGSNIIMASLNPLKYLVFYKNHTKIVPERKPTIVSIAMQPDRTVNLRKKKFT